MKHFPIQDFAFFADESGISNDRYTVVSGLTIHKAAIPTVVATLRSFRRDHSMNSELKWSKVSNQKEPEYRALVETFFALNNAKLIEFHAVAFDNHKWDHKNFNDGDADIGLSKLYYQLIMHCLIDPHGDQNSLFVCLDRRKSSTRLDDLHRMLNKGAARDFGLDYGPVTQLVSEDSKLNDILQLNDVILGAISSMKNSRHLLAGSRTSKQNLANLVFEKSGLPPLEQDSPPSMKYFTFWNRKAR